MLPAYTGDRLLWILKIVFPFHYAAWKTAFISISELANAPEQERECLLQKWREAMLSQLTTMGLIGAIMSAIVVGSFTWSALEHLSIVAYTIIRVCWYNSLILAITAVAVGMQQSVFLVRIGCLSASHKLTLKLLCYEDQNGTRIPRRDQVVIWQTAVGMLEFSLYFWLGGFVVFIWDVTLVGRKGQKTSDKLKLA
ncbi:hypothetical protein B0J14DRAFT_559187 [Halenospora varia]|nr:hypothetical protein B0J14DRAFT_559187 [Halenospora varia]